MDLISFMGFVSISTVETLLNCGYRTSNDPIFVRIKRLCVSDSFEIVACFRSQIVSPMHCVDISVTNFFLFERCFQFAISTGGSRDTVGEQGRFL